MDYPVCSEGQGEDGDVIRDRMQLRCNVLRNKWYQIQTYMIDVWIVTVPSFTEIQSRTRNLYHYTMYNRMDDLDFFDKEEEVKVCIAKMCKELWNDPYVCKIRSILMKDIVEFSKRVALNKITRFLMKPDCILGRKSKKQFEDEFIND